MKVIVPPIKSQGIKTKLVPHILEILPSFSGRWIEPFLGTGVVAFNSNAQRALLADVNPHIIHFYRKLKEGEISPAQISEFLFQEGRKLQESGDGGDDYYRFVRNRFNTTFNPLDFLFLSRAGFNGMMRFNREGKWNIPFCKKQNRFAKAYITKIVHQCENCIAQMTDEWVFEVKDFREIILQSTSEDFIYCDPPYAGRYVDYYSGWTDEDESDLFDLLRSTKAKFILSSWHHNDFRYNTNLKKYEQEFNVLTHDHFYFAGARERNRNSVVEALVLNFVPTIKKEINNQLELFADFEKAGA